MKLAWILVVAAMINGEPVVQLEATGQEQFATQSQCQERIKHPAVKRSYVEDYWPGAEIVMYCKMETVSQE